jgi:hypothetical protein
VPHLMLSWPDAVASAAFLAMVAAGIRLAGRFRALARAWTVWAGVAWEAALLFGLYALWMFAGSFTVMSPGGALPRCTTASTSR